MSVLEPSQSVVCVAEAVIIGIGLTVISTSAVAAHPAAVPVTVYVVVPIGGVTLCVAPAPSP